MCTGCVHLLSRLNKIAVSSGTIACVCIRMYSMLCSVLTVVCWITDDLFYSTTDYDPVERGEVCVPSLLFVLMQV